MAVADTAETLAPGSEAALAETVRDAAAAGRALAIRGGGTRNLGAPVAGTPLSTAGLAGITLYEPGALTLVARAGTALATIEAALAAEGQRLPFEPVDHRALTGANGAPTLGGMVAVNASGPRRPFAGACRDAMLGVRFVDGRGRIVKNGGRVMKNVTGIDLVKLMAGSHGTLGILTEVALKVLPAPETTATLIWEGLDPTRAVALMTAATATPFEVTGAAHLPGPGRTLIRIEGFEASVRYRRDRLIRALAAHGPPAGLAPDDPWPAIRDVRDVAAAPGDVWRISVRPTDGPRVLEALGHPPGVMDWAGGLLTVALPAGTDARAALTGIAGHATILRAAPETLARLGAFHPEAAPLAAIAAGLRAQFDPKGILNPGRMALPAAA